jgi:hypothetical protein
MQRLRDFADRRIPLRNDPDLAQKEPANAVAGPAGRVKTEFT